MKQIKEDLLLGITIKHPITCPLINALQFNGEKCTRIFNVEINECPKHLIVDSNPLIEAIEGLNQWTDELIDIYESFSKSTKIEMNEDDFFKYSLGKIYELRDQEHSDNINEYEKEINKLIEQWNIEHIAYVKNLLAIEDAEILLRDSNELLSNTHSSDEDAYAEAEENVNDAKDHLNKLVSDLETKKESFENSTKNEFENLVKYFSNSLEKIRERNDRLRSFVTDFRTDILDKAKSELDIYQPNDYLNENYGIKDSLSGLKILNIGLLFNEYIDNLQPHRNININGNIYFKKLIGSLEDRKILTKEDRIELIDAIDPLISNAECIKKFGLSIKETQTREYKKETLFNKLKEKGFEMVRYYESPEGYMADRSFVHIENLIDNKVKSSLKIKQSL